MEKEGEADKTENEQDKERNRMRRARRGKEETQSITIESLFRSPTALLPPLVSSLSPVLTRPSPSFPSLHLIAFCVFCSSRSFRPLTRSFGLSSHLEINFEEMDSHKDPSHFACVAWIHRPEIFREHVLTVFQVRIRFRPRRRSRRRGSRASGGERRRGGRSTKSRKHRSISLREQEANNNKGKEYERRKVNEKKTKGKAQQKTKWKERNTEMRKRRNQIEQPELTSLFLSVSFRMVLLTSLDSLTQASRSSPENPCFPFSWSLRWMGACYFGCGFKGKRQKGELEWDHWEGESHRSRQYHTCIAAILSCFRMISIMERYQALVWPPPLPAPIPTLSAFSLSILEDIALSDHEDKTQTQIEEHHGIRTGRGRETETSEWGTACRT